MNAPEPIALANETRWKWLPTIGTWKYHALLASVGMLILGPLGGVTASYMNFSLGFFVGGQVLAGILGSVITFGYGTEGKHGANYMQTTAASVAGMSAMGVLIQAMVWLGLPQPPVLPLVLYMLCIGMFGAGVGMLYTPILVDKLQLTYPSGLAVANILRALTDPALLKRSVGQLVGGMLLGILGGVFGSEWAYIAPLELSMSTFGAGMVVGARIGIPAFVAGLMFKALVPFFISIGWLHEGDPFRKIAFLIALGMILGAALIDLSGIALQTLRQVREKKTQAKPEPSALEPEWKRTNTKRLIAWVVVWGIGIVLVGSQLLNEPVGWLLFAIALVFVFAMVNGISVGISDSNPISSAFVVTVVLMAALGLKDPTVGLIAAAILLVSTGVACDMQQDRSTGWRLGTNRIVQFRYQVGGIVIGAIGAVVFARLFMNAYPVLSLDQTSMSAAQQPAHWTSAMTYKFVGTLRSLTDDKPYQRTAIFVGILIGFAVQAVRKLVKSNASYRRFAGRSRVGFCFDFFFDAFLLPSPYAFSFGGFVNLVTSGYIAAGGVLGSIMNSLPKPKAKAGQPELPDDMSTASLLGGGLIAGDALAALGLGIVGLLATMTGS
jgi:uncharacterized oligopeptide transporter (OPT) family protein